jgi:hypothetical protein
VAPGRDEPAPPCPPLRATFRLTLLEQRSAASRAGDSLPRAVAYAYLSASADFVVSQVVDRTKGVHGLIRKADAVRRG